MKQNIDVINWSYIMAKLTFLGATGTVTGSRYHLEVDNKNFLIDCGLFQGPKEIRSRNWEPFPVSPSIFNKVVLTHAHIDHSGYLPRFCRDGFDGQVICTTATQELCNIMLRDSAHLQEEDAKWANKKGFSKHDPALPLYTVEDAEKALTKFAGVFYGHTVELSENVDLKFKDAGHILGASILDIRTKHPEGRRKIMFSGDLGRPLRPVLKDPVQVYEVDYLILESTYGDRLHGNSDPHDDLARIINTSYESGGVLIIPSFAVGRTQDLLHVIRELEDEEKIPVMPIYVDSPMAINTTRVFDEHIAEYNIPTRIDILNKIKIFEPQNLHLCMSREESMDINNVHGQAIIISASGMVTGGRILHHLKHRLPDSKNTVLLIGYQGEGTRGRTILEGNPEVKIHGEHVPIKAKVENITGFSAHADYNEILAYLMGFNRPPEKTFIIHGEPESSKALAEKIRDRFGWDVVIPEYKQSFELDF